MNMCNEHVTWGKIIEPEDDNDVSEKEYQRIVQYYLDLKNRITERLEQRIIELKKQQNVNEIDYWRRPLKKGIK